MKEYNEIKPEEMDKNIFNMIAKDWMLITAKDGDRVNTMTASWGGMGVFWGDNVVYAFIRQSRYTKEFVDHADSFSLCFFDPLQYKKDLAYLGKTSGRDTDKIKNVGFHIMEKDNVPFFEEADTVILCKKVGRYYMGPEGMLDEKVKEKWYADGNYHDLYIGRIDHILENKKENR